MNLFTCYKIFLDMTMLTTMQYNIFKYANRILIGLFAVLVSVTSREFSMLSNIRNFSINIKCNIT